MVKCREIRLLLTSSIFSALVCGACVGTSAEPAAPTVQRLALLIGINEYPSLPDAKQLRGCLNDVKLVRQTLLEHAGFSEANIITLRNQKATQAGISRAFDELAERVDAVNAQGMQAAVVFHYSGHGSQVLDQFSGPERDEVHYFDQTLVPYDAESEGGEKDIRDDELNAWAQRLTANVGNRLLVVLDCCHSGTGLRDNGGRKRQLDRRFDIPNKDAFSDPTPSSLPKNVAVVSACLPTETEDECTVAGDDYGLLTAHLCKLARDVEYHGSVRLRDLPVLLRWQYLARSTPPLPPHPQIELARGTETLPLFFASESHQSNRRLGLLEVTEPGVGVLNRGIIDGVTVGNELKIVGQVDSNSAPFDANAFHAMVTSAGAAKSSVRVVRKTAMEIGDSSTLSSGTYFVLQQQNDAIPSIRVLMRVEDANQQEGWLRALSDPVITMVDSEEDADRVLRIMPDRVRIEMPQHTALRPESSAPEQAHVDSSRLVPHHAIVLERGIAQREASLPTWHAIVRHRLREIAAGEFLTRLVAQHASGALGDHMDEEEPKLELVVSKFMPPEGQFPDLRPCETIEAGIAVLETGDLYAIQISHPRAHKLETYATIIHIDPLGEISVMCPREFSQTEMDRQRIDASKGMLSSIYMCNGDAMLKPHDAGYALPTRGVHKAIVLFGSSPPDLSSLEEFLRTDRAVGSLEPRPIEIEFNRGQTRSGDKDDKTWWDARIVQWFSR